MIFDAFSNATCRVSPASLGAELQGCFPLQTRAWKSRSASGRRVTKTKPLYQNLKQKQSHNATTALSSTTQPKLISKLYYVPSGQQPVTEIGRRARHVRSKRHQQRYARHNTQGARETRRRATRGDRGGGGANIGSERPRGTYLQAADDERDLRLQQRTAATKLSRPGLGTAASRETLSSKPCHTKHVFWPKLN